MSPICIIESPYAGKTPEAYRRNIEYLHAAIQDCLARGEVPYASHGFFPGALDDTIPEQRKQGIRAGFDMAEALNKIGGYRVFYIDRGWSSGMRLGQQHAEEIGQSYIERRLDDAWGVWNDPYVCEHEQVLGDASSGPDGTQTCPDCGKEFKMVCLPQDAIAVAHTWMEKKA